jgi:asparaginyl-tRNA synthetase
MIKPEIAFAGLGDNATLAEALLKYTFAALLTEREKNLAFFDQRVEKGLVLKLEGIVGSEFVHMDFGEAIGVLERSNQKFEFPVSWGVDLQSEHERYLTEQYAKKPVVVMNYPKAIKAFYMRVNDDGRTVATMDVLAPEDRRDHRRQPARGAADRYRFGGAATGKEGRGRRAQSGAINDSLGK